MDFIWTHRANLSKLTTVYELAQFATLRKDYGRFGQLIENGVQRMVCDVQQYDNPPYCITQDERGNNVIGYNVDASVVTSITYGYKTAFAYMNARDTGLIRMDIVQQFMGIKINCGQFSYAEVPKNFSCILGVTGTLTTLGDFEKRVMQEEYKIIKQTVTPSIYGPSNLKFKQHDDVFLESEEARYFQKILSEILEKIKLGQAVLVFFVDDVALRNFSSSAYGRDLTLTDFSQSHENLDFYVKKATRTGEVSLLPRVFGRGMDFACRDPAVEAAGGVHVVQTFLSEELSEEVQIRGRTARQGKKGSYCIVLLADHLNKTFGIALEELEEAKKGKNFYAWLNQKRIEQFNRKSSDREGIIKRSLDLHREGLQYRNSFMKKMDTDTEEKNLSYLLSLNKGKKSRAKVMCISDATGSMSSVWANAKVQIKEMLQRIEHIGGKNGMAQLMWVAFRDYCDKKLLEKSEWTSNPQLLIKFINKIKCTGGGDAPEAVEVALQLANNTPGVSRVILIGDAEPHLEGKGNYVAAHKKTLETDYLIEAKALGSKNVPVYCFYMNTNTDLVNSFTEIAKLSGGRATLFNNVNTLIDVIAENVLDDLGGEELVQEYRRTYHS